MRERRTRKIINHEILDLPIGKQARSPAVYCPMVQCSGVVKFGRQRKLSDYQGAEASDDRSGYIVRYSPIDALFATVFLLLSRGPLARRRLAPDLGPLSSAGAILSFVGL
jgi:hypothetical protein